MRAASLTHLARTGFEPDPTTPPHLCSRSFETFTTGQSVNERQVILREIAPAEVRVQVRTSLDQIGEEQKPGVVLLLNDLNRNREIEMNLRRLDRLASVGILTSGIAHEIKNALVAMKTFTELLLEQNKDTEIAGIVGRNSADRFVDQPGLEIRRPGEARIFPAPSPRGCKKLFAAGSTPVGHP
jgi:nitrogen-specific signal transduction histidine kinase